MSCGPGKFSFNHPKFSMACSLHDKEYEIGLLPRKEVDYRFLKNMIKVSTNIVDLFIAVTMYIYVVLFGWTRYKEVKDVESFQERD